MFILAAITDSLDGYLARRLGQTSALGAFLDPVADKLMVATALILLVSHGSAAARARFTSILHVLITLTAAVIVGREITISALREWMAEVGLAESRGVVDRQVKTIFQMTGLSMMLFRSDVWFIPAFELGVYCLVAAAGLTLWSMIVYLRAAWPDLMRSVEKIFFGPPLRTTGLKPGDAACAVACAFANSLSSGAQRKSHFSQATLEKPMDGLFNSS